MMCTARLASNAWRCDRRSDLNYLLAAVFASVALLVAVILMFGRSRSTAPPEPECDTDEMWFRMVLSDLKIPWSDEALIESLRGEKNTSVSSCPIPVDEIGQLLGSQLMKREPAEFWVSPEEISGPVLFLRIAVRSDSVRVQVLGDSSLGVLVESVDCAHGTKEPLPDRDFLSSVKFHGEDRARAASGYCEALLLRFLPGGCCSLKADADQFTKRAGE